MTNLFIYFNSFLVVFRHFSIFIKIKKSCPLCNTSLDIVITLDHKQLALAQIYLNSNFCLHSSVLHNSYSRLCPLYAEVSGTPLADRGISGSLLQLTKWLGAPVRYNGTEPFHYHEPSPLTFTLQIHHLLSHFIFPTIAMPTILNMTLSPYPPCNASTTDS